MELTSKTHFQFSFSILLSPFSIDGRHHWISLVD